VLKFTSEIVDDVLFRASEPTDGTSDFDSVALDYVNRAYRAIWTGGGELVKDMNEPWLWLKKDPPGVLVLNPVVNAGSVTVTQGVATITFSSPPAASVAGRFFKVDSHTDIFRILTHTGGNATATLDAGYTGPSGAGFTFRVMQLEYPLAADVLRVIAPMRVQAESRREIEGCDLNALDRDFPLTNIDSGTPDRFALVTEGKVRFNRYGGQDSTTFIRVEYEYLQKPSDLTNSASEEPLVPLEFRQVLADYAVFMLYQSKSDQRAETAAAQAKGGLLAMASYNRNRVAKMGRSTGLLITRPDRKGSRFVVPRTTSGFIIG
jgi:hypothetical protein